MEKIALYAEEVRRFVAQRISNPSDAEDVAQQALCIACEKIGTFRNGDIKSWLFTIARNLVVDHYRQQNRFQFLEVDSITFTERESALRTGPEEVQNQCDSRDRLRCYLCLTASLPLEEQVAVMLADLLGHRDRDSATAMSLSLPSFKLLLHRARTHMQQVSEGVCSLAGQTSQMAANDEMCGRNRDSHRYGTRFRMPSTAPSHRLSQTVECVANSDRFSSCTAGENGTGSCNIGIRCCRHIPNLRAIRDRLLNELHTSLFYRAILAFGLVDELPELACFAGWESITWLCTMI